MDETSRNEQSLQSCRSAHKEYKYELKAMKWGLIPFWTKRSPDYGSMLRTINCRDDSLIENRGMWNTMKQRKRCIVICQGFYEWLKKGPGGKEKVPHFVRRKDEQLMCFAGLWDCVKYEDAEEKLYTYTIITTDSNKQLSFLHDRMPVILDAGSDEMKTWLDPERNKWSKELQSILQPYPGELECYPVNKAVGKVGNNSADFIVPIDSKQNKRNIANFFGNAKRGSNPDEVKPSSKNVGNSIDPKDTTQQDEPGSKTQYDTAEDKHSLPMSSMECENAKSVKRGHSSDNQTPTKAPKIERSPKGLKGPAVPISSRKTRSATSNGTPTKSPSSTKPGDRVQTITSFFGK